MPRVPASRGLPLPTLDDVPWGFVLMLLAIGEVNMTASMTSIPAWLLVLCLTQSHTYFTGGETET